MSKEIIEGNKLIAEFMGAKEDPPHPPLKIIYKINLNGYELMTNVENFMFHSSWDWLMPACQKFSVLYRTEKGLLDNMEYMMHCDNIDDSVTCYEVLTTFSALVKAITSYNKIEI